MSDQTVDSGAEGGAAASSGRIGFAFTDENVEELLRRVENKAESAATTAAMGGRQDDGGASRMRAEIKAFVAGRHGEDLPDGWWELAMDIAREKDPEYAEWLRLKGRFGD